MLPLAQIRAARSLAAAGRGRGGQGQVTVYRAAIGRAWRDQGRVKGCGGVIRRPADSGMASCWPPQGRWIYFLRGFFGG